MAQPDPAPLEERARKALADAVAQNAHSAGFPVHEVVRQGVPSASDIQAVIARSTTAPTADQDGRLTGQEVSSVTGTDKQRELDTARAYAAGLPLTDREVAAMSPVQKLVEAFKRTHFDDEALRAQFLAAAGDPQALFEKLLVSAGTFAAAQFTPVGWAADIVLGGLAVICVGSAVVSAVEHLAEFAEARNATTVAQLDAAGKAFADACTEIGINVLMYLITRRVGGKSGGTSGKPGGTAGGPPAHAPGDDSVMLGQRDGQIVVVIVNRLPKSVAEEFGITASGRSGPPRGSGGNKPPQPSGGTGQSGTTPRRAKEAPGEDNDLDGGYGPEGRIRRPKDEAGTWSGRVGDSRWTPNDPHAFGLERGQSILWREGVPDLTEHTVPLGEMPDGRPAVLKNLALTGDRRADNALGDEALAERFGRTADWVKQWRRDRYRYHHYSDHELQLVPVRIHDPLAHQGSVTEMR